MDELRTQKTKFALQTAASMLTSSSNAAVKFGAIAMWGCFLLNGGAVFAALARDLNINSIAFLERGGLGAILAVAGAGVNYLAQTCHTHSAMHLAKAVLFESDARLMTTWKRTGHFLQVFACMLIAASLGCAFWALSGLPALLSER